MKKFCENCGKELMDGADICTNCGKAVKKEQVQIKKKGLPAWLKVIIIFIIVIGCVVACVASCTKDVVDEVDKAIDDTTKKKESLKLEEETINAYKDEYGISYYIEGYVKNTSNEEFSYVQIEFNSYDSEGATLGTCIDNNSGLEANGRWKFKAVCLSDVDNISTYKLKEISGW